MIVCFIDTDGGLCALSRHTGEHLFTVPVIPLDSTTLSHQYNESEREGEEEEVESVDSSTPKEQANKKRRLDISENIPSTGTIQSCSCR